MNFTHEKQSPGRWRTLRLLFRVLFYSILTWLVLAILWVSLPFPPVEHDSGYAASVLQAGKTLTRVYSSNIPANDRLGFALSYNLHSSSMTHLTLSGSTTPIPLFHPDINPTHPEATQSVQAIARTGDIDGANLPWFPFADSVLLFWWIHQESLPVELEAQWHHIADHQQGEVDHETGIRQRLIIRVSDKRSSEPLISIEVEDSGHPGDQPAIIEKVSLAEGSASPSWTYGIRACIIYVLAPMTVFTNDAVGALVLIGWFDGVSVTFTVLVCGFIIGAVVVSLWRCLGGPSLESTMEGLRGVSQKVDGRFPWMRAGALQDRIDWLLETRRMQAALKVCREGWHPEREFEEDEDRAREQDADSKV